MPRALSTRFRQGLEQHNSDELPIVLLILTHPSLSTPIRVANDIVDYYYDGNQYIGFPFEFDILTDNATIPRGTLVIQNVDRRIGQAIMDLKTPPFIEIVIVASVDFAEPVGNIRYEHPDGATIEYQAANLVLADVNVDASRIQGTIQSFDLTNEPWPAIRTTEDRLPGLEP